MLGFPTEQPFGFGDGEGGRIADDGPGERSGSRVKARQQVCEGCPRESIGGPGDERRPFGDRRRRVDEVGDQGGHVAGVDVVPPLTTVRLPLEQMGSAAARLALAPDPGSAHQVIKMGGEVALRASTRRIR